jgi:NTE family protein
MNNEHDLSAQYARLEAINQQIGKKVLHQSYEVLFPQLYTNTYLSRTEIKNTHFIQGDIFTPQPKLTNQATLAPLEVNIVLKGPQDFSEIARQTLSRERDFKQDQAALLKQINLTLNQLKQQFGKEAKFKLNLVGHGLAGQDAQYLLGVIMEGMGENICQNFKAPQKLWSYLQPWSTRNSSQALINPQRHIAIAPEEYAPLKDIIGLSLMLEDSTKVSSKQAQRAITIARFLAENLGDNFSLQAYNLIHIERAQNYLAGVNLLLNLSADIGKVSVDMRDRKNARYFIQDNFSAETSAQCKKFLSLHDRWICSLPYQAAHWLLSALSNLATPLQQWVSQGLNVLHGWFYSSANPVAEQDNESLLSFDHELPQNIQSLTARDLERARLVVKKPLCPIENLVFEGGGIKGVTYIGVLKTLEKSNELQAVQRVAGSSAGALVALLYAIGYAPDELAEALKKIDLTHLKSGYRDKFQFFQKKGLVDGKNLQAIIEQLIAQKLGERYKSITFQALQAKRLDTRIFHNRKLKELYITGTNLSKKAQLEIFSANNTPHMPIALAVRISMSFPLAFQPVQISNENGSYDYYVDGGLANNCPMAIFDDAQLTPPGFTLNQAGGNPATLGILVDNQAEIKARWGMQSLENPTFKQYVKEILSGLHNRFDEIQHRWPLGIIQIFDQNIATLDFGLNQAKQQKMIEMGSKATAQFIKHYRGNNCFEIKVFESFAEKYRDADRETLQSAQNHELYPYLREIAQIIGELESTLSEHERQLLNKNQQYDALLEQDSSIKQQLLALNYPDNRSHPELKALQNQQYQVKQQLIALDGELRLQGDLWKITQHNLNHATKQRIVLNQELQVVHHYLDAMLNFEPVSDCSQRLATERHAIPLVRRYSLPELPLSPSRKYKP